MLDLDLPEPENGGGTQSEPSKNFPGVLVFNNDVAFLNQFFSVMFIVFNNAPKESNLYLKDLQAKINYPAGLREAKTNPPKLQGTSIPVKCPGPDGILGTADDLEIILASFCGKAEFLAEGIEEGTHIVKVDFSGTLSGGPAGDVPVKGSAAGAVVVRYPDFAINFAHPSVVRSGEEYDIYITITNTSNVAANLVSLTMPASRLIGCRLLSGEKQEFETLAPGESQIVKYHLLSLQTGRVRASAFAAEGKLRGNFVLTAGIGEKGIPLSPDTITLPAYAYKLPEDILEISLLLLGEAYSVSTAPAGSLPAGIFYISPKIVKERIIELSEAGQRILFGDDLLSSLQVFLLDWLGNRTDDFPFEQLRLSTSKGRRLAAVLNNYFENSLKTTNWKDWMVQFLQNCSYKKPFFLAGLKAESKNSAFLELTDSGGGKLFWNDGELSRKVSQAEIFALQNGSDFRVELITSILKKDNEYFLNVKGGENGSFDLQLCFLNENGILGKVLFEKIVCKRGSLAKIKLDFQSGRFILENDLDGDGTVDSTQEALQVLLEKPVLRLISAVQDCSADAAGNAVALFFNREVDEKSARNLQNYFVSDKDVVCSFLQPSKRVIIVGLNNPVSPFFDTLIRVKGVKSADDSSVLQEVELKVKTTISTAGGVVFGKVIQADGTPLANAKVRLIEIESGNFEGTPVVRSIVATDESGNYRFDFVRVLTEPFTVEAIDPESGRKEQLSAKLREHGQWMNIDIVFRGQGSLRGKVFDENQQPVKDAYVTITAEGRYEPEKYQVRTNAAGEYFCASLPVGRIDLFAFKGSSLGFSTAAINFPGEAVNADIVVISQKYGRISGTVYRNDGHTPADRAIVKLKKSSSLFNWTYSGADGSFFFDQVPIGDFAVEVSEISGSQSAVFKGILSEGQTFSLTIILRGNGTVFGNVLEANGAPVAGAVVYLSGTSFNAVTDFNGQFRITDIPIGEYQVYAVDTSKKRQIGARLNLYYEGQEAGINLIFPAEVVRGGISGRVFREDGVTPAGLVTVILSDGADQIASVRTDSEGNYTFNNLLPRNYSLLATDGKGGGEGNATLYFPGQFVSKNIIMRGRGKIRVNVFAADGKSRVMADVKLFHTILKIKPGDFIGFQGAETVVTTDENGFVEFKDIFTGRIDVEACNGFYPYPVRKSVQLNAHNETLNVDLILKPTGKISGQVVAPDGQNPVGNSRVTLKVPSLPDQKLYADEEGKFVFTLVPSGQFELIAEDQIAGFKGILRGSIPPEGCELSVRLKLLAKGKVFGSVKKRDGNVVADASVKLKTAGFPFEEFATTSDSEGKFSFYNVSEGSLVLEARDPRTLLSGRASLKLSGINAESETDIYLEAAGSINGILYSPDGSQIVKNAQVILCSEKFKDAIGFTISNESGEFNFQNVPAGNFSLEIFHSASGRMAKSSGKISQQGEEIFLKI